ncbi:MAG: DegT/DnrJ/EryC1/StrS family aminotransferase, partial [Rubrivivax sp.]|nr:DegT/DnrJ/EryC1/StrS family aminotransferase [Rubrivivax sp.]
LTRFDWEIARRIALGERYSELLRAADVPAQLLAVGDDRDCVWAQFTVFVDRRAQVQQCLQAQGIPTAVHYPKPLHRQPVFAEVYGNSPCPHSDAVAQRVLSLPMSADLSDSDQQRVVEALASALMR